MPSRLTKTRQLSAVSLEPTSEARPEVTRSEPATYANCFGTGMEVVAGRGAWRCRAQERRQRLLEAAHIPRRYARCTLVNYRPDPGGSGANGIRGTYECFIKFGIKQRVLLPAF
jgi:hypothetical protein